MKLIGDIKTLMKNLVLEGGVAIDLDDRIYILYKPMFIEVAKANDKHKIQLVYDNLIVEVLCDEKGKITYVGWHR